MAKLHFYYSAMNAGKSTMLLQSAHNYRERGMDVLLFKPQIDTRSPKNTINSRIGLEAEAVTFDTAFHFAQYVESHLDSKAAAHAVLIDEAQFLTRDQVEQLAYIASHLSIPVLAYGLRSDFQAEPFEGSKYLLAWAEQLIEIKTICHCGKKATMNMRIDEHGNKIQEGEQIEIGGNDRYVAVCRKHFNEGKSKS